MKVGISGRCRFRVFRHSHLVEDVSAPNLLTKRGVLEIMGRLVRVTSPTFSQTDGLQINDTTNVATPGFGIIREGGFVALDRLDRFQYFDSVGNPDPLLGDNRQWDNFGSEVGPSSVNFLTGPDALPSLTGTKPNPMPTEVTSRFTIIPGAETWRGIYITHFRTGFSNPNIKAVLASAVLAAPLEIQAGDSVQVDWTLKLSPTFV